MTVIEAKERLRRGCQACEQTGVWHCPDALLCGGMCFEWKDLDGKWREIDYAEYEERLNFYKQGDNLRIAPKGSAHEVDTTDGNCGKCWPHKCSCHSAPKGDGND